MNDVELVSAGDSYLRIVVKWKSYFLWWSNYLNSRTFYGRNRRRSFVSLLRDRIATRVCSLTGEWSKLTGRFTFRGGVYEVNYVVECRRRLNRESFHG